MSLKKRKRKKTRTFLILATTDLIHYGPEYSNDFKLAFPQQQEKVKLEQLLIEALAKGNIKKLRKVFLLTPFVSDSPYVLSILGNIVAHLKRFGQVVDYYDSSSISKPLTGAKDILDLYTISWKPVDSFVSYVGMVWSSQENQEN